jgi:hypothetical protein
MNAERFLIGKDIETKAWKVGEKRFMMCVGGTGRIAAYQFLK